MVLLAGYAQNNSIALTQDKISKRTCMPVPRAVKSMVIHRPKPSSANASENLAIYVSENPNAQSMPIARQYISTKRCESWIHASFHAANKKALVSTQLLRSSNEGISGRANSLLLPEEHKT